MPTYEYRCKECGEHLEIVQSFTDDALTDCPACGTAGQLRKVFGSIGITFKGSGFYRTDSRAGSPSSSSKKDESKSESSSSDTKTDTKTDTKSDAKSDTKSDTKSDSKSSSSTSAV